MVLEPDDQVILASVDEPAVFARIFDRHYHKVRDYLGRRVNSDLADDLAADTFVTAFRKRQTYDARFEDSVPWLLGIATNLVRHHWRKERRELRAYAQHGQATTESDVGEVHDVALAEALATLSRKERDAMFLFACAELTYEEVGRALDVPVGTVRSRIHRARHRLRELLSAEAAPAGDATDPEVSGGTP
ncbi:RNA polymerase sigma factor [Thermoleophilia bacterium SCSIO 60948]|nr:RNA polymerase sigma factor [Thermoleophilia bacterium SCSIO 60948]